MADRVGLLLANPLTPLEEDDGPEMPQEYRDYLVMRTMGWDYWTFSSQPEFIIFMIYSFILAENQAKLERKEKNE